jgi:hypothetical protein
LSQAVLEVVGEEVGTWGLVVGLGDQVGQRDANLELESDAGHDLDLKLADLLLNGDWDVGTFGIL